MNDLETLKDKADANLDKWGEQDLETLALSIAEKSGELAKTVLQDRDKGGDRDRIRQEAVNLGALALQVLRHFRKKRVLYVEPAENYINLALEQCGLVTCTRIVHDFDTVHDVIKSIQSNAGRALDEVRIDTTYRTAEAREQAMLYGWREDCTFDVKELIRLAHTFPLPLAMVKKQKPRATVRAAPSGCT
jgi:NTP pyrophosphatase (non-canonical NTP hydrolase)